MSLNDQYIISVTGLGYVGLPVAVAMAKKFKVHGFDINEKRISELLEANDRTNEITSAELKETRNLHYSSNPEHLKNCNFHIITVPTPIDDAKRPDLTLVYKASQTVGKFLKKGDIVVYESTVYPGVTEEECIPLLEKASGLKGGIDFKVGYSPERINPGDKEHSFTKILKVVSGQDADALEKVAFVYSQVVTAGVYKAESIKVAEAAKVIENTQRDLNIALMNELAIIFDKMNIDTQAVLKAAGTKWNFVKFYPGLVGGHCIGVDPYYLTHKSEQLGYHPEVILAGRRINDSMGAFVANKGIKALIHQELPIKNNFATVLGATFKENCPDIRNSKVMDIVKALKEYGMEVQVSDPLADQDETFHEYGFRTVAFKDLKPSVLTILAVSHDEYKKLTPKDISSKVIVDVKGILSAEFKKEKIVISI